MKTYNINNIMALEPCYSRKQIKTFFDSTGKKQLTIKEICKINISNQDKMWVMVNLLPFDNVLSIAEDRLESYKKYHGKKVPEHYYNNIVIDKMSLARETKKSTHLHGVLLYIACMYNTMELYMEERKIQNKLLLKATSLLK
jgi:hypothetical protein